MPQPEIYTPDTLDEAAALLLAADGQPHPCVQGATVLAYVERKDGPAPMLVDLSRVPELNRLAYDERSGLLIGAALPLAESLSASVVGDAYPILMDGLRALGTEASHDRVTVADLLSGPSPAVDLALPLLCQGAAAALFGAHGWSEMAVEALCMRRQGLALHQGEFIVDVRLPPPLPRSGGAYVGSSPSGAEGERIGAAAFLVMRDDPEVCCGARLMVWTAEGGFVRALDAERFLQGRSVDEDVARRASEHVAEAVAPRAGVSACAATRSERIAATACQAFRQAEERARTSFPPDGETRQ
jgi:CO/xanthine dehydrogenase FAD-binding subunit